MSLAPNGDAQFDMHGELVLKQSTMFLQITNPAGELKRASEDNLERLERVLESDGSSTEMIIPAFTIRSHDHGAVGLISLPLSFGKKCMKR